MIAPTPSCIRRLGKAPLSAADVLSFSATALLMTPPPEPVDDSTTKPTKVLIVDDDVEIIESIKYALEGEGMTVVVARDGNQGLALAERENPDLMILDMMMPKRSGFLVLEKLRRVRDEPLPVIMITGNEGSRHQAYAELLGVSDYIRKPFAMDKLLESVHRLIAESSA